VREITADWPERVSFNTQPPAGPEANATFDFVPGPGWKLFDVTSIVRHRVEEDRTGHGIVLRFASASPSGGDRGYTITARGVRSDARTPHHPVLLVVETETKGEE
jgi:hypothetical protein